MVQLKAEGVINEKRLGEYFNSSMVQLKVLNLLRSDRLPYFNSSMVQLKAIIIFLLVTELLIISIPLWYN